MDAERIMLLCRAALAEGVTRAANVDKVDEVDDVDHGPTLSNFSQINHADAP